jgi:hypothetical protein
VGNESGRSYPVKGRLCRGVVTATAHPKRSRDATVTDRGSADEAVVAVKRAADDEPGDRFRGENGTKVFRRRRNGGEGRNMVPRTGVSLSTVVTRSAVGAFFGPNTYAFGHTGDVRIL